MLKKHFLTHNGLSWSSPYLKSGLVQIIKKHSKEFNLDLIFFPSIVFASPDLEYGLIQI